MAVQVRHIDAGSGGVALISGVDTPEAVAHLCRSLASGGSFPDHVVILDLRSAPETLVRTVEELVDATRALESEQRWLGVVTPAGVVTADEPHAYESVGDALAAGRRYFRLVTGIRPWHPTWVALRAVASSVVTMAPVLAREGTRLAKRGARAALRTWP